MKLQVYDVIFLSVLSDSSKGYHDMAQQMEDLAKKQTGFLGLESVRDTKGITISYWESLDAINTWKQQSEHLLAQKKGVTDWNSWYKVQVCKVEREYEFFKT